MFFNATEVQLYGSSRPGYLPFYQMSYLWYSAFATFTTSISGLIVSFITGHNKTQDVDPKLLSPLFHFCSNMFNVIFLLRCQHDDDIVKSSHPEKTLLNLDGYSQNDNISTNGGHMHHSEDPLTNEPPTVDRFRINIKELSIISDNGITPWKEQSNNLCNVIHELWSPNCNDDNSLRSDFHRKIGLTRM